MRFQVVVTDEARAAFFEQRLVRRSDYALLGALPAGAGAAALLVHFAFEAFAVDGQPAFAYHIFLLVERQAEGVVEFERHSARHHGTGERFHRVIELLLRNQERGGIPVLLVFHHARDLLDRSHQLGVSRLHQLRDKTRQFVKERLFDTNHARVPHGAAHDFAQHVAAPFV